MASFTDTFNRANGALGASWTAITGNLTIVSNAAAVSANSDNGQATYATVADTNDHKTAVTLNTTPTTGDFGQLYIRFRTSPFDGVSMMWNVNASALYIFTVVNSVEVQQAVTGGFTFVAGDTISLEAVGNLYVARYNGAPSLTWSDTGGAVFGSLTDSSHRNTKILYNTGAAGANHGYDSFAFQDITASAFSTSQFFVM